MNLTTLTQNNNNTMTSREIALVTSKRHDHVVRDIENLNQTYLGMSFPKVGESSYIADNGHQYKQFILNK